mmetsp:Transcript_95405/g.142943  ORF Transcript_95405/g.142943 Transcript_95405/m.142943 type:complete len:90 (+) Transcript_95405:668-937(+)
MVIELQWQSQRVVVVVVALWTDTDMLLDARVRVFESIDSVTYYYSPSTSGSVFPFSNDNGVVVTDKDDLRVVKMIRLACRRPRTARLRR